MAGKKPRRGILGRLTRGATRLFRTFTGRGGFTPDRVTVASNQAVGRAQRTETALIRIATEEALVPLPNRGRAIRRIRQQTAYGLGQVTAAADRHTTDAEELGTVLGHNMVTPDPSQGDQETDLGAPEPHDDGSRLTRAQALRLADTAIRPPRNPDTGNTPNIPRSMRETIGDLAPTVTRSATDLFDGIAAEIKRNPPTSDTDRRRTAQRVLDDFHKRGITGMVDKAGRRWNLATYVEMATRTAATELARRAQVAEVLRAGMDIVRVTVMPNCNPLCQPFQGRLLSLTGKATHDALGEPVVTTLKDALTRGYNHIGCRHTIVPHVPGSAPRAADTIDPGDYKAVQKLRSLEVEVRKAKTEQATALTDEARAKAGKRVRAAQKRIREHVAETGVVRVPLREQIDRSR